MEPGAADISGNNYLFVALIDWTRWANVIPILTKQTTAREITL